MAKIITISGASASGKDAILKSILKSNNHIIPIVSLTSRPMWNGEENGVDYLFVTEDEMQNFLARNVLIQIRSYKTEHGIWHYAIHKESIDLSSNNVYIVILDIDGVVQLKNYVNEMNPNTIIKSFFIDCSSQQRLLRSLAREQRELSNSETDEIIRRFLADQKEVVNRKFECDVILKNELKVHTDFCAETILNNVGLEYHPPL